MEELVAMINGLYLLEYESGFVGKRIFADVVQARTLKQAKAAAEAVIIKAFELMSIHRIRPGMYPEHVMRLRKIKGFNHLGESEWGATHTYHYKPVKHDRVVFLHQPISHDPPVPPRA